MCTCQCEDTSPHKDSWFYTPSGGNLPCHATQPARAIPVGELSCWMGDIRFPTCCGLTKPPGGNGCSVAWES